MRKALVILLVLLLMSSYVFSAGNNESSSDEPGEITLTFWEMNYGSDDSYLQTCEALISQYEAENPGVNIEVTLQPWDNYYQLFLTAVTSNSAPDIASVALDMPDMYARMGEALYLDDVINSWKEDGSISDYQESTIESFTYDGHYIAIPYMVGYRGVFYRSDILSSSGVEKFPETWDELLDACAKIKEAHPDIIPLVVAGNDMGFWHYTMNFALSNDVGIVDAEGKPASESQNYIETIDFLKTFVEKGYVSDGILGHTAADIERIYYSGNAAIMFTSFPTSIFNYPEILENTEVGSSLLGPSGTAIRTNSFSDALMVFSQTEYPEEAMKFVKWWAENTEPLFSEGGCWAYPARASFFEADVFSNKIAQGVLNNVVPTAVPCTWPYEGFFVGFSQINGEHTMNYSAQEAFNNRLDTQTIVENQSARLQEAIDIASE